MSGGAMSGGLLGADPEREFYGPMVEQDSPDLNFAESQSAAQPNQDLALNKKIERIVSPDSDGLDGHNTRTMDNRDREDLALGKKKYDSDNKEKCTETNTTQVDKMGGCSTNDISN
jgi:hypothetical protein